MATAHTPLIEEHEKDLDDLRRLFDLYFQGIERQPPKDQHEALRKRLLRLRGEASSWNTAERFRVNTLQQKFGTYDRMWARQLQAIEDGTHRRDRFRVQRKRKLEADLEAAPPTPAPTATSDAADMPPAGSTEAAPAKPKPTTRKVPAAADAVDIGMSEEKMRKLYNVYMQAKKRTGERSNLSYEGLTAQLRKQVPALRAKHNCKDVDFKVVLKDGKALLKAVPKP